MSFTMLLLFNSPVVSDSLRPHGLQHSGLPCPSLSPKVCPSSCPLHRWWHPGISSSDTLFCPQSFSASGTFPMSQLFALDDQNNGVSASTSILPTTIQGWVPLKLTGWISLQSKGLSGVSSSTTVQKHQFFGTLPLPASSHIRTWPLGRLKPWLHGTLSAEQCLCFSTHCLGLPSLSCQEAISSDSTAAVTVCSDSEPKQRSSVTASATSPLSAMSQGAGAMVLDFLFSSKLALSSPPSPASRGSLVPLHFLPLEWYHRTSEVVDVSPAYPDSGLSLTQPSISHDVPSV